MRLDDPTWPVTIHEWDTKVKVPISIRTLAEIFCNMDDDKQARFFVEVADIMGKWEPEDPQSVWIGAEGQAQAIGGHLRNCECSTEAARELIRSIAYGLEHSTHGKR